MMPKHTRKPSDQQSAIAIKVWKQQLNNQTAENIKKAVAEMKAKKKKE